MKTLKQIHSQGAAKYGMQWVTLNRIIVATLDGTIIEADEYETQVALSELGLEILDSKFAQGLHFDKLRVANVTRCETAFNHLVSEWTPNDWATATAGELGELCNLLKKRRRGEAISQQGIADELADTVIYFDLLAASLDINLGEAVRSKFNEVSKKRESEIRL